MSTDDIKISDILVKDIKTLNDVNDLIEDTKHLLIKYPDHISLLTGLESLERMKRSIERELGTEEDALVQQAVDLGILLTECKAYGKKYNLSAKEVVGCLVDLLTNQQW